VQNKNNNNKHIKNNANKSNPIQIPYNDQINDGYNNNSTNNNYNTNNTIRNINLSKGNVSQKESFLKKALENMSKNNLNKSEDSQIFNMEKNDQITDNIIMENEKTSLISRNYLQRQVSKNNSFNKIFSFENKSERKNVIKHIKRENSSCNLIYLLSFIFTFLANNLQVQTVDFYKKRMDYLTNIYLNVKNNPFDNIENNGNSTKKNFSKFIPKSAFILKERKENYDVHLIKKSSDFKNFKEIQIENSSKTANLKNKTSI